jgi:MoaA/NifB/PqqE/SkfB family radical SAM enzyme
MSTMDFLLKRIGTRLIAGILTGKPRDLRRLLLLQKLPFDYFGIQAFLKGVEQSLPLGTGLAGQLLRIGKLVNPQVKRRLIENLIFNWGVIWPKVRTRMLKQGTWIPNFIAISPTMRCNLRCRGCYSGMYSKDEELSSETLDRLLCEAKSFGSYFAVITGGEPYLMKDTLLPLFRKHNDMFFLTFTNGTLLDQSVVAELAELGNVAPGISVEGFRELTDRRRGQGVYDSALEAARRLREAGVFFGISVTYTSENLEEVTSEAFVKHFIDQGAQFAWYFMFMPVGKDPVLELVPSPEQRVACGRKIGELRQSLPLFMADFWNDGPEAGGCLAGARSYLHILPSGRVEACVFAHFGVDSIYEKSILEAANSPFFRAIRAQFPYNENGNLRRPCMIIDNPEVLRNLVEEYLVPQGHPVAEDIIRNPRTVAWVDQYAQRFRELTDPLWEAQINDPRDRWYREGKEYQDLFRFKREEQGPDAKA